MSLIVQKFGGTSVADLERIANVANIVAKHKQQGSDVVVVVSAMSGETNRLLALAGDVNTPEQKRELDALVATGEKVTSALLAITLQRMGVAAESLNGAQIPIRTDSSFNKARIESIEPERIQKALADSKVVIVAGFQGIDTDNNITTLGRGGSDTTAVALAAALKADECQIYTDVDGVYTTDPRIVSDARRLEQITVEEMLEMASLGAKVLQIRSVEFAGKYQVPLRVLSSMQEGEGTLITQSRETTMEAALISGIACQKDEAKISVLGIPDAPGTAYQILGAVSDANIEIDVIVQNIAHEGLNDLTFTVHQNDAAQAFELVKAKATELHAKDVAMDEQVCKVSIVGVGMRSHAGIASTMFKALADEHINVQLITTSEIKISVVIAEKYMELAVKALHRAFNLAEPTKLA